MEKMRVSKSEKQKLEIERKLKELQKSTPPSKKIGFTKMFAVFILLMNTILFAFALFYAWTYHDVSFIERLMIVWGGEMSIITGFIVWKSKQENITKIKGFYDLKLKEMDVQSISDIAYDESFDEVISTSINDISSSRYTDDI